jgi:hypothetical protein
MAQAASARIVLLPLNNSAVRARQRERGVLLSHRFARDFSAGSCFPGTQLCSVATRQASDAALDYYLSEVHKPGDFVQLLYGAVGAF